MKKYKTLLFLNLPFLNQSGMIFPYLKTNPRPVRDFKGSYISGSYTKITCGKFFSFWHLKTQCHVRYILVFRDCIIKTRSASCSKKVAERSVNVEFSANVDSKNDKENAPDVIGNEEYDFLFGSDDIYSDFEGFDEDKILSTGPNFTPTKNGSHDKNTDELTNVQQKTAADKNALLGFSINNWKKGDSHARVSIH